MAIQIFWLYMYCTIIHYVLYIYAHILFFFYIFHIIIRVEDNYSTNYIYFKKIHTLYLVIPLNDLILCKTHFSNVNPVVESIFCRKK